MDKRSVALELGSWYFANRELDPKWNHQHMLASSNSLIFSSVVLGFGTQTHFNMVQVRYHDVIFVCLP